MGELERHSYIGRRGGGGHKNREAAAIIALLCSRTPLGWVLPTQDAAGAKAKNSSRLRLKAAEVTAHQPQAHTHADTHARTHAARGGPKDYNLVQPAHVQPDTPPTPRPGSVASPTSRGEDG